MDNPVGYVLTYIFNQLILERFQLFIIWMVKKTIQAVQFEDQDGVCAKKVEGRNKRVKIKKYR